MDKCTVIRAAFKRPTQLLRICFVSAINDFHNVKRVIFLIYICKNGNIWPVIVGDCTDRIPVSLWLHNQAEFWRIQQRLRGLEPGYFHSRKCCLMHPLPFLFKEMCIIYVRSLKETHQWYECVAHSLFRSSDLSTYFTLISQMCHHLQMQTSVV